MLLRISHSWTNHFQLRLIIFELIVPSYKALLYTRALTLRRQQEAKSCLENHAWNDSDEGEIKVIDFQGRDKASEWVREMARIMRFSCCNNSKGGRIITPANNMKNIWLATLTLIQFHRITFSERLSDLL